MIETLYGLLAQYSPTGFEENAVIWLVNRMNDLGYTKSFVDKSGNAIGMIGDGPKQLVLLGHIDTVPGEIPLKIEQEILYGRGAVDAKGPLAAFVDAAARIEPSPGWTIIVIGAIDEEGNSKGARSIINEYDPIYAIIGEPNQWDRIALGYKGSANVVVNSNKPLMHSSRLDLGACESVLEFWLKLKDWVVNYNQIHSRIFPQIQISLNNWDYSSDDFQEQASIKINSRLPPDFHPDQWFSLIDELIGENTFLINGLSIPAWTSEKNTHLVRAFLRSIRKLGGKPNFVYKTGTCDANLVAQYWQCPLVVYGAGDSNLDHTPNENINLEKFYLSVDILENVLRFTMKDPSEN